MNDKEKTIAYLLKLQTNAKSNGGKSPLGLPYIGMIEEPIGEGFNQLMLKKSFEAGIGRNEIEEFLKHREASYVRLKNDFSSYENPNVILMLGSLQNHIRQSFSILDLKYPENVVLGTLPFGKIQAWVIPVPENSHKIIAIDPGIFTLIHLFAKLINYACKEGADTLEDIPLLNVKNVSRYIDEQEDINNKFTDVLLAYLITGNPNLAQQYFEKESDHKYSDLFRETSELFILAHEYGHVFYDHIEKQKIADEKLKDGSIKMERWKLDWYKEDMADDFAILIVLGYNYKIKRHSITDSFIGITFFFSIIQILSEALSIPSANTHPDAIARINNMHTFLIDNLKPRRSETGFFKYLYYRIQYNVKVGFALRASMKINKLMMYLWNKNKDKVLLEIKAMKIV